MLGLSIGALDIIEHDGRGKAELCCNAMFEKWLEIDRTASWKNLFDAGVHIDLELLPVADHGKIYLFIIACMKAWLYSYALANL